MRTVLLPIFPEWAEAILNGSKKWEYRKISPKIEGKYRIVLYATKGIQSVVGEFITDRVLTKPIDDLIKETIHETPNTPESLKEYFKGYEAGCAIRVTQPKRYTDPISLGQIRSVLPSFSTPQSFIYLDEREDMKKILELIKF